MADQDPAAVEAAAASKAAADAASLKAAVEGAVKNTIETLAKEGAAKQAEAEAQRAADAAAQPKPGAFDDLFKPALEPVLKRGGDAEARAAIAEDAVQFYTDPANAAVFKYRAMIEQVVKDQQKRGYVVTRKDAWAWLRGGELYDELTGEVRTAHETKLEEARKASTAGPGVTVPKFAKPIDELKTDELGEALKGVTF